MSPKVKETEKEQPGRWVGNWGMGFWKPPKKTVCRCLARSDAAKRQGR